MLSITTQERKHLTVFLDSGLTEAKVNTKYYTILSGTPEGNQVFYKIRIITPARNDYGKSIFRQQIIELTHHK